MIGFVEMGPNGPWTMNGFKFAGLSFCLVAIFFLEDILRPAVIQLAKTHHRDTEMKLLQRHVRNETGYKRRTFKSRETNDITSGNNAITTRSETGSYEITYVNYMTDSPQKPRHHIAFLKVHKAASSTAQNILLRYGYQRNLTFVLPRPPTFWYPNIISMSESVNERNTLPPPFNKSFDILCCHVIYNRKAFEAIMPNDTVYIGIVREPSEHIRSTIQYMQPPEILKIKDKNSISVFLKNPERYVKNRTHSWVNNRMSFEYNFPENVFQTKNETSINTYLQSLATEFSLVIVVEYFAESVVLMRRILQWNIKDILYVKKNASQKKNAPKLTLEDKQRHRQWAVLEYALYEFFFKRLWDQIEHEGKDFYDELLFFRRVRRDVTDFCLGANKQSNYVIIESKWSKEAVVTSDDCDLMFKSEIPFIQNIRLNQYGNLTYGLRNMN